MMTNIDLKVGHEYWTVIDQLEWPGNWPRQPFKCLYFVTHEGDGVIREFVRNVDPHYVGPNLRVTDANRNKIFDDPIKAWEYHMQAYEMYCVNRIAAILRERESSEAD